METINRIFDLLPHYAERYSEKDDAIAGKTEGKWIKYNINQYIEIANNISYGLFQLGIEKGDKIATISNNCPEWNFLDMGILQSGAIHVPVYPTISESDYTYILQHSAVKFVFVSGKELLRKMEHILPEIPNIIEVFTIREQPGYRRLEELIALGKGNPDEAKLDTAKASIKNQDLATIIYTSGTTGNPKGVMLTHNNLISNFKAVSFIPPVGSEAKAISYLPLCHVYERMLNYMYQYLGISIYYAENVAKIADNIKEIKPEILSTVPRLLEKIYDKILAKGRKLTGIKKQIFFWSVNLGLRYEVNENGWFYKQKLKIADALVFKKWRAGLGGNFRVIVSGGAALQSRLSRIFWAAGIPIIEGYGLTETSPVIAVSHFGENGIKFGTVGPVLQGVEVKIANDGEILAKGPNIMKGYYMEEALTKEAIDKNGFFHTGDIGQLEAGGQLRITGRKKSVFKTSFGKYISPEHIENKFKESPFIDAMLVVGENQKFAAAIVVPEFYHLKSWCAVKEIEYTTNEDMIKMTRIRKRFQVEVDKFNRQLGDTEKIKKFELIDKEWSIESGELTPSLKLKRNYICNKYKSTIDKIFSLKNS